MIQKWYALDHTKIEELRSRLSAETQVFQLGRIRGNFLFVLNSTSLQMSDKQCILPMLAEHRALFGEEALASVF
ncbi:MAG: hypothetical protein WCI18_04100 [Pseudomonadota bacterium]